MEVQTTAPGLKPLISHPDNANCSSARTNDDRACLNLSVWDGRRQVFDNSNRRAKILSCKHSLNVATMNVRTLRLDSKRIELASNCNNQSINILGVVDHKIVHDDDPVLVQNYGSHVLITTSAWRNSNNAAAGGVGFMISKSAETALAEVIPVNERIVIANFNGNGFPALSIIVHYSPVEGNPDAEQHYQNLLAAIHDIPKHNVLLVIGDFNAHLGTDTVKYSYHESTNKNGELVLDMVEEAGLAITNTLFRKKPGKLWTYISDMSGSKTQVDFIMVNKKWKNSVKNCEAYSSFSSIGSDHRVVTAKLKLSLRTCKTPPKQLYDWNAIRNPTINNSFTIAVRNKYSVLSTINESATDNYDHFIQSFNESAEEHIPKKKRAKQKRLSDDIRVQNARKDVQCVFAMYQNDPNNDNQENLRSAKAKLQEAYDAVTEEELSTMINRVHAANSSNQHGESWKLINKITGRKAAKRGILKGKSQSDRLLKWHQYFSQLLGKEPEVEGDPYVDIQPVFENLGIRSDPFDMEEYLAVKKTIVLGKSPGPDGIPPDVLKLCDFDDIILSIANKLFEGDKPDQWSIGNLIPIPKSGNLSEYENYRGIMLTAIAAKLTNKMILKRIQPEIDKRLRPNQNGFRPGRSTTAQILALRRIIEGVKNNNLKSIIVFVDFRKAFDSIHRGKMMQILKAYGVPETLVGVISKLYENTRARVVTPDGDTELFDIIAGVLQGDTLAPYLFAIVLDYVMRQAISGREEELGFELERRRSRRHPPVVVTDLDFADDIALLCEEIRQAQELLNRVEVEAAKVGLHVNAKKTEAMPYNHETPVVIKTRSGNTIKEVDNFKYLGAWSKSSEKDFTVRKALAWSACHDLRKIWNSALSRKVKVHLFCATVEYVLTYGSETWTLTKALQKQLDGCYTRMLRMALNISWKQKLTNEQLYQELPPISCKVRSRRMRLAGHCHRHTDEIASRLVFWEPTRGRPSRGRPAINYIDNLKADTNLNDVTEIKALMEDRVLWRKLSELARAEARRR